ncbi:hypothetical protein BOSP111201_13275 [Bordetella sputigena]|uniref:membrane-targeted effector domain-containing toxin n=1 Tax=Bordetella sputigena TaxID=1416810 RepID=UPI0039EF7098
MLLNASPLTPPYVDSLSRADMLAVERVDMPPANTMASDTAAGSRKYELSADDRPVLRTLVEMLLTGELRMMDAGSYPEDWFSEPPLFPEMYSVMWQHEYRRRALREDAAAFFERIGQEGPSPETRLAGEIPDTGRISGKALNARFLELLDGSGGLVVGEAHSHPGARKLLMDNMQALEQRGVRRLYLEHVLTDVYGPDLRALHESPHQEVSADLVRYLELQTADQRVPFESVDPLLARQYSYRTLVEAAQRAGIEVVAIDCAASYFLRNYSSGRYDRFKMMNYYANLVMREKEQRASSTDVPGASGKWIALVGTGHVNRFAGTPGLAELMGVAGVVVADGTRNRMAPDPGFETYVPGLDGKQRQQADVLIEVDMSTPRRLPGDLLVTALRYLSCYPARGHRPGDDDGPYRAS